MKEIKFGDVSVTRVVEYRGDAGTSPEDITPSLPLELWRENRSWLQPDHVNADFTSYVGALQTWVVRSEGKTILLDSGAGNDKDRPLPMFAHLHTSFLADLAAAGVAPDEVDLVINTHLHMDHTGWHWRSRADPRRNEVRHQAVGPVRPDLKTGSHPISQPRRTSHHPATTKRRQHDPSLQAQA